MTNITPCPFCGALHAPVIIWSDGRQSLCCPDKIYQPFERKEDDVSLLLENKEVPAGKVQAALS